jgi:hypothetical protein
MKTLNYLISLLVVVAFSYGCARNAKNQQDKFQTIKINLSENTTANLSGFVENPQMIKLETNDSCLIDLISQIETTPDYLFVADMGNVYKFDKEGNYLRKIGSKGHGPYEYTNITCFTSSAKDKRIYIGANKKLLCFDFEGNPIEEIKINFMPDNLTVHNNQLWVFYTKYDRLANGKFENRYIVNRYTHGYVLHDSIQMRSIKLDHQVGVLAPNMQYLSEAFGQTFLYSPILIREPILRDTLYRLEGNRMVPAIKVDFSDFLEVNGKGKNISIQNINRTDKYLIAEYGYKSKPRLFVHDFSSGKQYNLTEGFADDIFGTGKVVLRPLDIKFEQMYFAKYGYELARKIEGVTENDNPVLFIFDFKK